MADDFERYANSIEAPAFRAAAVTPNDSADLTNTSRALYIGGAGNVQVTTAGGDTVTFTGLAAGTILPVRVRRIWSTSTTATTILALW